MHFKEVGDSRYGGPGWIIFALLDTAKIGGINPDAVLNEHRSEVFLSDVLIEPRRPDLTTDLILFQFEPPIPS